MEENKITIDEFNFFQHYGEPFSFSGVFTKKTLSGIKLSLDNLSKKDQEIIKEILQRDQISVYDPFSNKEYKASTKMISESYTAGTNIKSYIIEISETDLFPDVKEIEIDDEKFSVIKYEEFLTDGEIGRTAILRLNEEEFITLRNILTRKEVKFKRIGIDDKEFNLRFGSRMYWSKHKEDQTYYKHIVRFYPINLQGSSLDFASNVEQSNLIGEFIILSSNLTFY